MMDNEDYDPLDEPPFEQPKRDKNGRFTKGTSGNVRGRPFRIKRDPSLPASRRRIINSVADEIVEVKVNGVPRKMTMYEANVRSLAMDGIRNRTAADKFIDLANETSEEHLKRRLSSFHHSEYMNRLEEENAELRKVARPTSGVVTAPVEDLTQWPPKGLIDDEMRVNFAMVDRLQLEDEKRQAAKKAAKKVKE